MGNERRMAVVKEVQKLVEAGILREVRRESWVANPVMVKKSDGTWRMCVDYTDLNKACTKDSFPLPNIDAKIDSLAPYRYKCFLDAYKGYHQIKMAREDEDKTAFHTDIGIFLSLVHETGRKREAKEFFLDQPLLEDRQASNNILGGPPRDTAPLKCVDLFDQWVSEPLEDR
ncbi:hypothetical protein QVD17_17011 [Tagetes erecta]|uniref:Reverse transcriptase domain-containing protein n=1 Tax=Tagetes erecta TaxID=13708 RepID=A0AAD8KSB8_TARER|nr:hypothetical protein QVD17_17011 [Tagetes erecta]